MKAIDSGGRLATALVLLCLTIARPIAAYAVNPPQTGDPGGGTSCKSCEQRQTTETTGSATAGDAQNTDAGSQFDINYQTPSDGQLYSGSLMTQVVLEDGSVSVQTFPISDWGLGDIGFASAWNNAAIPDGGTASISINMTAPNGASFTAGFIVRNFGR